MSADQYSFARYGIECAKGWASLYEPLIERCKAANIDIFQIKQKFGGLRFYVDSKAPADLLLAIHEAQQKSFSICEECGAAGSLREKRHYVRTLCDKDMATWK